MNQEPFWWEKAREMRREGMGLADIGFMLRKNHTSVLYAVDPKFRARHKAQKLARSRALKRLGLYSKPNRRRSRDRRLMVNYARNEAEEVGGHIDLILLGWGVPPRRIASIDDARRIQRA